jgi:pimeloyl-ACP methyl ester carboxylesterase
MEQQPVETPPVRRRRRRSVEVAGVVVAFLVAMLGPVASVPGVPAALVPTATAALNAAALNAAAVTAATPAPSTFRAPRLVWERCGPVECTALAVPVDHARPRGARTTVAVHRVRAADPSRRIGVLVVNPGGPGVSSQGMVDPSLWPAAIHDRFDLVGLDPRFTGAQAPRCRFPAAAARALRAGELARAVAIGCAAERSKLANMGADDMARDLEVLRVAMGEATLSLYVVSWGAELGARYGELFPRSLRALVVDSPLDVTDTARVADRERALALNTALDERLRRCTTMGVACAFNDGTDLSARYTWLQNRVAARDATAAGQGLFSRSTALQSQVSALLAYGDGEDLYRYLTAIATASDATLDTAIRSADPDVAADEEFTTPDAESIAPFIGASLLSQLSGLVATECLDGLLPRDAATLDAGRAAAAEAAPRFSTLFFHGSAGLSCIGWPIPVRRRPVVTPPSTRGGPVPVVLASSFDTQAPISWARRTATALGAPLVVRDGFGHGIVGSSDCMAAVAAAYLADPATPVAATGCPAS